MSKRLRPSQPDPKETPDVASRARRRLRRLRDGKSLGKVVLHTIDHRIIRGFSKNNFIGSVVKVIDDRGNEETWSSSDLKAIFFVREFMGNPDYSEVRFFSKEEHAPWLWVRITFQDGEPLEGRVANNRELLDSQGFFLWPSDRDSNTELVYIYKSAIKGFAVLGM